MMMRYLLLRKSSTPKCKCLESVLNESITDDSYRSPATAHNIDLPDDLKGPQAGKLQIEYMTKFSSVLGSLAAATLDGKEPDITPFTKHLESNSQAGSGPISNFLTLGERQAPWTTPRSHYTADYQELELLGRGGYGYVYKVRQHVRRYR
jgi:hypothetical protein